MKRDWSVEMNTSKYCGINNTLDDNSLAVKQILERYYKVAKRKWINGVELTLYTK